MRTTREVSRDLGQDIPPAGQQIIPRRRERLSRALEDLYALDIASEGKASVLGVGSCKGENGVGEGI